jgi:hypothetical protein
MDAETRTTAEGTKDDVFRLMADFRSANENR